MQKWTDVGRVCTEIEEEFKTYQGFVRLDFLSLSKFRFTNITSTVRSQIRGETRRKAYDGCRAGLKYLSDIYTDGIYYGKDSQRLNKLWVGSTQMSRQNLSLEGLTWDMLNGAAVSWKSTRQKSVSLSTSTAGADTSEADKEIVFLRSILKDFGFEQVSPAFFY